MDSSEGAAPFTEIASTSSVLQDHISPLTIKPLHQCKAVDPKNTYHGGPQPHNYAKVLRFPVKQSAFHIGAIILGNTITMALIVICLYRATREESMNQWEKRVFNFAIIMLSAVLSLGIGYFFDQLGLFSRGQVLASTPHTELSVRWPHLFGFALIFSMSCLF